MHFFTTSGTRKEHSSMNTALWLAALSAVLASTPAFASAQVVQQGAAPRDSLAGILALVAQQRPADEITQLVQIDCFSFPFDGLAANLKRKSGYENMTQDLMRRCSRLR